MPHGLFNRPHLSYHPRVGHRLNTALLRTDGRSHPKENRLAVGAGVIGLVAITLGLIVETHVFGAIAGLIGFPIALYSQMLSRTSGERWLNVIGMIGSFVGLALSVAHGGFMP